MNLMEEHLKPLTREQAIAESKRILADPHSSELAKRAARKALEKLGQT
jgi:hypothetical protein